MKKLSSIIIVGLSFLQIGLCATVVVDGVTNACDVPYITNGVSVVLPGSGTYTFTLAASDFSESYSAPARQRHVLVTGQELRDFRTPSGPSDFRTFSLNGAGDSRTVYWDGVAGAGWIRLFFLDEAVLYDNVGTSTVVVSNATGWVGTYVVDSITNCLNAPLSTVAKTIALPEVGTYKFTLVASDFSESYSAPAPQRHVLVAGSSDILGDFRNFSLNGIGDSKTLRCALAGDIRFFFVDYLELADNMGTSTVQVERVLPALSVSVASVAIGWMTDPAEKYQLQFSSSLSPGSWTNLGDVVQGTGTNTVVFDSVLGQPQRFYRLTLVP